jgi:hypothetical protein
VAYSPGVFVAHGQTYVVAVRICYGGPDSRSRLRASPSSNP